MTSLSTDEQAPQDIVDGAPEQGDAPQGAPEAAIALPEIFDLNAADAVRERLIAAIDDGAVSVDGSQVQRIATNSLFLLMSAHKTAKDQGHEFTVSEPSPAILEAVECLGIESEFKEWMTE